MQCHIYNYNKMPVC